MQMNNTNENLDEAVDSPILTCIISDAFMKWVHMSSTKFWILTMAYHTCGLCIVSRYFHASCPYIHAVKWC